MTSPITPGLRPLAELRAIAEKASPGPWSCDSERSEGSYGHGDDVREGFDAYVVYSASSERFGKALAICDTLNSDVAEVHEEFDEDGFRAWDEVGRRNMEFIAAFDPPTVLALLARIEELKTALREAHGDR